MTALPTDLRPFSGAELRFHIALAAGELAHREGGGAVADVLATLSSELTVPRKVIVAAILQAVCEEHGCTIQALTLTRLVRGRGAHKIAYARWDAMTRLRALRRPNGKVRFGLVQIGEFLGGLDHSTVSNGLRRWVELQSEGQ